MDELAEIKIQIDDREVTYTVAQLKKHFVNYMRGYYIEAQKAHERGVALNEACNLRDRFKQRARVLEIKCDALLQCVSVGDDLAKQLKAIEWSAGGRYEQFCPDCQRTEERGHSVECDIEQVLIVWSIVNGA